MNSRWKQTTGWSKKTVTCNFFLADLKVIKNGITQTFLKRVHREVLIFWYHNRVRWKKIIPIRAVPKIDFWAKRPEFCQKCIFFAKKKNFQSSPKILVTIMTGQQKTALCVDPVAWRASGRPPGSIFGPKISIFLRYTHITPIFWGQTDPTQWDLKSPISWGNSG